jgi:uncharacterized protein (DUF305 family)
MMKIKMMKIKPFGTLWVASVVVAGCAAPPTAVPTSASIAAPTDAPAATSAPAEAEAPYDARFIDSMIMHHEGAVAMANDALKQAERPEIKTLSEAIIKAQEAEIKQMQEWRKAWYPDLPNTGGTGMSMGMMEVAAGAEPYDLRFIDAMIPHHQGAIDMAEDLKRNTQRPELLKLADDIIAAQSAEIAQMRTWRAEWSGSAATAAQTDAVIQAPAMAMLMGSDLMIDLVKSPEAGWLVIHAANGDEPGEILGFMAVPAGESQNVEVKVSAIPAKMIAMLHVDKGVAGQFEFPGDDAPLMLNGKPVTATFSTMAH